MSITLERPVFFVGMPRSGTTIVFEAFARHPQLAWPSNYTKAYPGLPMLEGLRRLLDNRFVRVHGRKQQYQKKSWIGPYIPRPNEAYDFWDRGLSSGFSREWLIDTPCPEHEARALRARARSLCRWQGRGRFSAKLTGPPRMHFLRSAFGPESIFVHVIRDARAVVDSLLRVDFWRDLGALEKPLWNGGLAREEIRAWEDEGRDPGVLAALQWRRVVEVARAESRGWPPGHYMEVRYETFMEDPHGSISELFERCGLDDSDAAHASLDAGPELRNMNDKFRENFDDAYIRRLGDIAQPMLSELGYD